MQIYSSSQKIVVLKSAQCPNHKYTEVVFSWRKYRDSIVRSSALNAPIVHCHNERIIILTIIIFPIALVLYPATLAAWTTVHFLDQRCKLQLRWPAKCKWQTIQHYIKTFPNALRTPAHQINNLWDKIQFLHHFASCNLSSNSASPPRVTEPLLKSHKNSSNDATQVTQPLTESRNLSLSYNLSSNHITYPKVTKAGMRFVKKITQPDFWAKKFTHLRCVNYGYFYSEWNSLNA